ncbi:MAG: ferrochelatase [Burkholderiales bacterium]|nr:ferrochelatase [Burkholderiales bacterium]
MFKPEPLYSHGRIKQTAVLIVNLGTPEAPTKEALKPYLREFLSDPRVVEIPRAVWWTILNGYILNTRPAVSAKKYAQIWTREGSPLKRHTESQAKLLQGFLVEKSGSPVLVDFAMRYGNPSIAEAIDRLKTKGCDRLLVIPLYPQYAASASGTVFDSVFDCMKTLRNPPELRIIKHFHDHPGYIEALAANISGYWKKNGRPEKLVISFHGVPRRTLEKGDPYHCECLKTGRLLATALNLPEAGYAITFQSRFGRAKWLEPYTVQVLETLGKQKCARVDVVCPGFVSDCLETLEEINMEVKTSFMNAGGGEFNYIPALNESETWIHALTDIAMENLHGWLDTPDPIDAATSRERALKMGAKDCS